MGIVKFFKSDRKVEIEKIEEFQANENTEIDIIEDTTTKVTVKEIAANRKPITKIIKKKK